jgi:hypothetical protein
MWTGPEADSTQAGWHCDENIYPAQVAVFARLNRRLTFQNRELAAAIHGSRFADINHDLARYLSENVDDLVRRASSVLSRDRKMFVIITNNVCHHRGLRTNALS